MNKPQYSCVEISQLKMFKQFELTKKFNELDLSVKNLVNNLTKNELINDIDNVKDEIIRKIFSKDKLDYVINFNSIYNIIDNENKKDFYKSLFNIYYEFCASFFIHLISLKKQNYSHEIILLISDKNVPEFVNCSYFWNELNKQNIIIKCDKESKNIIEKAYN